MTVLNLHLF